MKKSTAPKIDKRAAKSNAAIKAQIAARVAPEPRKPNVVKKKYLPDSPGALRAERGTTLTKVKASMNALSARGFVMLDAEGNPTGEERIEAFRDTAAITLRRRNYTGTGLLGQTKFARRKELHGIAVARKARRKSGTTKAVAAAPVAKKGKR